MLCSNGNVADKGVSIWWGRDVICVDTVDSGKKGYPASSAAEVLSGSLPLFDDSKDGTVIEYRDESDDEGNLVIDLKEK